MDGEWAGDGKRAGCGQKRSGMGTERERAADRRGVGWGTEGEWAGNGRCVGWGWDGGGLGEEGDGVGRMEGM